ncbi:MAG TPA: DUF4345 family protein [Kofleriaceae bacterium]
MSRRHVQIVIGAALVAFGAYLTLNPFVLGVQTTKSTEVINLRASYGGTLMGLGAFVAWVPALKPWLRTVLGLVMWAMAGILVARLVGFVLDGSPDGRQAIWVVAEVVLVVGCALALRRMRR